MLLIQVVTAALLFLGSGLIFKALAEIDAPSRPRPVVRPRPNRVPADDGERPSTRGLPRAA